MISRVIKGSFNRIHESENKPDVSIFQLMAPPVFKIPGVSSSSSPGETLPIKSYDELLSWEQTCPQTIDTHRTKRAARSKQVSGQDWTERGRKFKGRDRFYFTVEELVCSSQACRISRFASMPRLPPTSADSSLPRHDGRIPGGPPPPRENWA